LPKNYYVVRDPIFGYIKYNHLERDIINSSPFQRLRYIRQLSLTNLVYPGADHTRFAHSLGVMEMASRIFDTLMAKHQSDLEWDNESVDRNRQLLRLMALLHDTGHPPFSHASEELFENGIEHEDYTVAIIKSPPISEIIDAWAHKSGVDITSDLVSKAFAGRFVDKDVAFLTQIFSGEIDADRMDYLLRDSLFAGVTYGKFDYERLIHTLCLIPDPGDEDGNLILAVEEGGIHAIEALILARYFMFTQVYFHRVRRSYDHHLVEFLRHEGLEGGVYPRISNLEEYLGWDDVRVINLMRERSSKNEDAQAILTRNHYVEAFQTKEHITSEEMTRFEWLFEKVCEEFRDVRIFVDDPEKEPHKFEKYDLFVKLRHLDTLELVNEYSSLIKNLKLIKMYRLFVHRDHSEKIRKFCKDFWLKHDKP